MAVSLQIFTLSFALIVGASLGFAQVASPSRPETTGASIEGMVTVAGPQRQADAVPSVLVTLAGPSRANDPRIATTDAAGRYSFVKLAHRRLRFGLYSINLTNHANMLGIYNNVTSPNFGHLVGFEHRVNGLAIDVVN